MIICQSIVNKKLWHDFKVNLKICNVYIQVNNEECLYTIFKKIYDSKIGMCQVKSNIFLTWNTSECTNLNCYFHFSNLRQKGKPFCIYKYELLIQMYFFEYLTFLKT